MSERDAHSSEDSSEDKRKEEISKEKTELTSSEEAVTKEHSTSNVSEDADVSESNHNYLQETPSSDHQDDCDDEENITRSSTKLCLVAVSSAEDADASRPNGRKVDENPPEEDVLLPEESPENQDGWEDDTRCGLGPFKPRWLQKLASKKTYVLIHGFIGMCMFALGAYFVATISTLEKRFKIPSRTSGVISAAWDIGPFFSILLCGYLGGRGHKTRYVAAGTFFIGASCFMRLIPQLLYGPGQDALELTEEYGASLALLNINSSGRDGPSLCGKLNLGEEDCSDAGSISMPAVILFLAHIVLGIGGSMYYTLGMAYLDDNTKKNKAPIYIALTQVIRMLGPTLGFVLASYTLSQYVDPSLHPTITNKDPRWIGAWWLGWAPLGTVTWCLGAIMVLFPRRLPRAALRDAESAKPKLQKQKSVKDFKATFGKLLKNKVLMLNTFSGVCFMFGYIGYWTFMPKYMETQFRQSAARASLISGSVSLAFTALGIMTSAIVISKFKPRARYLAAWNVVVELVDCMGHLSWALLGCPADDLHGSMQANGSWSLLAECNSGCECGPSVKYAPICSLDGSTTFYSACHAGCLDSDVINGTRVYSNCSCVPSDGLAMDGPCSMDCGYSFTIFLITQCAMYFLGSSGRAGNTLIHFRCVDEEDKPMAIALGEFLLCALAFIPGPIVYGLLLDSVCLVWGEVCGQSGNCWLYDGQSLRLLLNCTAAAFLLCGTSLDVGVWYYSKDLKIYDEEEPDAREEKKKKGKTSVMKSLLGSL